MTGFKFTKFLCLLITSAGVVTALAVSRDRDYLDDYFDKVVINFNQQLDGVGISSLPINDTILDINRTVSGVAITGLVSYKNAIVLDVVQLEAKSDGHRGYPEDTGVHLSYQINFQNLTISSLIDVDLKPFGLASGSADLLFLNTSISVYIEKNYTLGTTSVSSEPYSTSGPKTNFLPVSDAMDAAAALARLELGYRFLWDHVSMWCKLVFTPMISRAVNDIEFPLFPPEDPWR